MVWGSGVRENLRQILDKVEMVWGVFQILDNSFRKKIKENLSIILINRCCHQDRAVV